METRKLNRIILIGSGGSGKTTAAKKLNREIGIPLTHMDQIYWNSDWKPINHDEYIDKIKSLAKEKKWIVDNAIDEAFDILAEKADVIIYLDSKRAICFFNVFKRHIIHIFKEREDTPKGSNNRIYLSFLLKVWRYPKEKRPGNIKKLLVLGETKMVIILNKVNKKRKSTYGNLQKLFDVQRK